MRMIAALAFTLLPLAAGAAQPQPAETPQARAEQVASAQAAQAACDRFVDVHWANGAVLTQPPSRAQRLGELPAGDLSLTVQRQINGCIEPVIIREGIGAFETRPAKR